MTDRKVMSVAVTPEEHKKIAHLAIDIRTSVARFVRFATLLVVNDPALVKKAIALAEDARSKEEEES